MSVKKIVDGITVHTDKPLPVLTHIINTHNEGPDLRQTIISFKTAYSGSYHGIIIADGTTDGSCDLNPLMKVGDQCPRCGEGTLGQDQPIQMIGNGPGPVSCTKCEWRFDWNRDHDSLKVVVNKERVGCGKAKEQAQLLADPDSVIIHSDGHCRWMLGSLDKLAQIAHQNEVVVCPGVTPLHCPPTEQPRMGDEWGDRQTRWKKNHTTWGGKIKVEPVGTKVDGSSSPGRKYGRRETTFWAIFMMSAHTLRNRLGGWNKYPGKWGSQEIGLALRAWFADVPIITSRNAIAGHRYRKGQDKADKRNARFLIRTSEKRANHRYAHQVVFDIPTSRKVWKPNWRVLRPHRGGHELLKASELTPQGKAFRKHCKRRTDEEFKQTFCPDGWPQPMIPVEDITAVVLCYRRPVNQQKCIDAIRAAGITVWAWCNDGAVMPRNCERIFVDSSNASTWGRYCVAPLIPTDWILFCDDDVELTRAGISALRRAAQDGIDNSGLIGAKFKGPGYDSYRRRAYYKSHDMKAAMAVDMLWPKGQLIFRELAVQVFGAYHRVLGNGLLRSMWQDMRKAVGSTSGDDLVSTVAQSMLFEQGHPFARFPHVVPSEGKGYREHHAEGKADSLAKQPGRMKKKRGTMKIWRDEYGWRSVDEHILAGTFEHAKGDDDAP